MGPGCRRWPGGAAGEQAEVEVHTAGSQVEYIWCAEVVTQGDPPGSTEMVAAPPGIGLQARPVQWKISAPPGTVVGAHHPPE
jgi:hypothetical protein